MKNTINLLLFVVCTTFGFSQITTPEWIDYNNASGRIGNDGSFFNVTGSNVAGYSIPKNSLKTTIYQFSVWMAGLDVNNNTHLISRLFISASDPEIGNYIAGPWSTTGQYQSSSYLNQYFNSTWKVEKADIDYHIANYMNPGYAIPPSINNWPGNGDVSLGVNQQLAPFVDLNGNEFYEPNLGEYPDIPGGQAVYLIMTDRNSYPNAGLGLEMHFMFYQFNTNVVLSNTTFLNVKVINKSTMDYHDFKMTFYLDPDIGFDQDDYIGSDTLRNMIYAFNGDDFDEDGSSVIGYGANPPAQGVVSLNTEMESAIFYNNGSAYPYNDPFSISEFWNAMNGLWQNGSPIGYGGIGGTVDSLHPPTKHIYPGDPITGIGWSETNYEPITSPGISAPVGDRRMIMTISQDNLNVGESKCSDFAFITSFSGGDNFSNVTSLKNAATYVQQLYDAVESFPCRRFYLSNTEIEEQDFTIYPNPNNGFFTIELGEYSENVKIRITDLTGKTVFEESRSGAILNIQLKENTGLYFVTLETEKGNVTKKILVK